MFGVLFGWRKASKCKKVIKQAQCRLKLLKKKRHSIVRHLREDTAHLIKIGHEDIAFDRAEQLIKDESVAVAYELIDNFCDFIRTHFSYIRRHKDCPDDINEAVSSLIYASARCGDLPELRVIRKLFEERYGQKLAMAAVELFPGNLVNQQIKEALNMKSVSDDMKHRMVNEIATDYCLRPQLLALEYHPEWQENVKDSDHQVVVADIQTSTDERSEVQTSNAKKEGNVVPVDSSPTQTVSLIEQCPSQACQDTNVTGSSAMSSTLQLAFPIVSVSGSKEERIVAVSFSESLLKSREEALLVYLDDVEEIQSSKDEDSQDQRVFKFKSPILSKRASFRNRFDRRYDTENYDSWNEKLSSKSSQRSCSVSKKRTRRRLVYQERQNIEDIECTSYYAQPQKSTFTHKPRSSHPRKQQKKIRAEESERLFSSREMGVTSLASNRRCYPKRRCSGNKTGCCNVEQHPSYFSTNGDDEEAHDWEASQVKQMSLSSRHCRERQSLSTESNSEMDWAAISRIPSRRSLDHEICMHSDELKGIEDQERGSQQRGHACLGSCRTRKGEVPSYFRTATMPPERSKDGAKDEFQRSNSCPVQEHPKHVHPKLPDYDDLTARFMALKQEFLVNKLHRSNRQL